MKRSESCDQLYAALALARASFGIAARTKSAKISSEKATYSYNYAPLEECFGAIDKALGDQGLALVGGVEYDASGKLWVLTHLGHTSGQWIENALDCGVPKNIKDMGGLITYARRYGVMLTVQMHGEDDDDVARAEVEQATPPRAERRRTTSASHTQVVSPQADPVPLETPLVSTQAPREGAPRQAVDPLLKALRETMMDPVAQDRLIRTVMQIHAPQPYDDKRLRLSMTWAQYDQIREAIAAQVHRSVVHNSTGAFILPREGTEAAELYRESARPDRHYVTEPQPCGDDADVPLSDPPDTLASSEAHDPDGTLDNGDVDATSFSLAAGADADDEPPEDPSIGTVAQWHQLMLRAEAVKYGKSAWATLRQGNYFDAVDTVEALEEAKRGTQAEVV